MKKTPSKAELEFSTLDACQKQLTQWSGIGGGVCVDEALTGEWMFLANVMCDIENDIEHKDQ